MSGKAIVLVLCTGNSCRSQMAAGFLRHFSGDRFGVHSAGTDPKPEVHPHAVAVMREIGVDISDQVPRDLAEYLGRAPVRHLLVVCDKANGSCPRTWPGAYTREFMPFEHPAEFEGSLADTVAEFRRVRDHIGDAMKRWEPKPERVGR